MSRTLSGLFLVGALNRPRKRKRTNRENPRTIPEQIGKIPEKSGKSQKGQKRTKKEGQVQIGKPRLKPPRLAVLDFMRYRTIIARYVAKWGIAQMGLCETKYQGGVSHHFGGVRSLPLKVSRDMGYRSDSITISRDMGPLS